MSTNDGYVIGATKLVDHGPDDERLNLFIVSEGYTVEQLPEFPDDVDEFVSVLFATPPFSALDLELAINVWQMDVVSDESGADDPGCDPKVTQIERATYFDASYCYDNVDRALAVNDELVNLEVDAYVPYFRAILVLVNSGKSGGTGAEGVAVTNRGKGSTNRALHELGHAAFGLADEYEYYSSCLTDDPSHDMYAGPEPPEPNLTKSSDPSTAKWSDLIDPPDSPVVDNPLCTSCNPEPSPLPPDAISLFEGAGMFHCGLYRAAYNCKMRQNAFSSFCAVCQRHIREVLEPWSGFATWPVDLAVDVEPWPATLERTTGLWEFEWDVQVTDGPDDFSGPVTDLSTGTTTIVGGAKHAFVTVHLKGGVEYHWRVRKSDGAWTKARSFVTAPKQVVLESPGRGGPYHPWALKFSWSSVDQAESYEVEVAEDGAQPGDPGSEDFGPLIFPTVKAPKTHTSLDVKVKASLRWRARAIPPMGPDYAGRWSQPVPFQTKMPKATAVAPDNGPVYPWPVPFTWLEVVGAGKYVLQLARERDTWGEDSQYKDLECKPPETGIALTMKPRYLKKNEVHYWRVLVQGPPPLLEWGDPSNLEADPRWIVNNGDDTIPDFMDSEGNVPPEVAWWMIDGTVELSWLAVHNAVAYRVLCRTMNENGDFGSLAIDRRVSPQAGMIQEAVVKSHQLTPAPGIGIPGYWWNAVAVGPEEVLGLGWENGGALYVMPDVPQLLDTAFGVEISDLTLGFTSNYTPSGLYTVELTSGSGTTTVLVPGNPGGVTSWSPAASGIQLEAGITYQWRVRAHSELKDEFAMEPLLDEMYPWSDGGTFTTPVKTVEPPAVVGSAFTSTFGELVCVFTEVPGADAYEFEIKPADCSLINTNEPSWPLKKFPKSAVLSYTDTVENALGQETSWFFMGIAGATPIGCYVWQVRAYVGDASSSWSDWSVWGQNSSDSPF